MESLKATNTIELSRPIIIGGFVTGLILSFAVLNGDNAGRVNLLYLLLIFLFIPLVGAIISVVSLFNSKGVNIARAVISLPIWTGPQRDFLHKIRQQHLDKQWLFLQSQAAAIAYSGASLLTFLILLLATDINFVWRSTLLNAEQLYPFLQFVSLPWFFWESAQPSLELLSATQDSRLTVQYGDTASFGQWWTFILATQIFYSFLLRGILLLIARSWIKRSSKNDIEEQLSIKRQNTPATAEPNYSLAPITNSLPIDFVLANWAGFAAKQRLQLDLTPSYELASGPQIASDENSEQKAHNVPQLILVKAWEPPMGELEDYMQQGQGLIFPINTRAEELIAPEPKHLIEWQRFTAQLPQWRIYLPEQWKQNNES